MDEQRHTRHRGSAGRGVMPKLMSLGATGLTAMIVLSACGPKGEKPYTTLDPASTQGDDIQSLYILIFWLSLIVFVGVQFALVYLSMRYRQKKSDTQRPPVVHGSKTLEMIWTIVPAIILLAILIPTINVMFEHDAQAREGDLQVEVYGKQWWWEFHLAEDERQGGQSLDVVTANEIVIPLGRTVTFNFYSNNVIHSFWVPQLQGKMDVIPGHQNTMAITPTEVGEFYGECAEFCGAQHAWMRFKVVVVEEQDFYNWVNNWRTSPAASTQAQEGDTGVIQAPAKFSVCLSCHKYNGFENSNALQGINAPATFGPDLTMLACRESIAAGMLENTPENLAQWILDPGAVKPHNYMATMIGPGMPVDLTPEEAEEFADFLLSMEPAGGCYSAEAWSADGDSADVSVDEDTEEDVEATPAA